MTDIDDTIDDVRDAAVGLLNSEGRSAGHVAMGVVLTAGFVLLATGIASGALKPRRSLKQVRDKDLPITERPRGAFSLILPAMFSATTLSAVRVWNAPSRPERTRAMGLWLAAQTVNAVWLGLRPASMWRQVAAAMSSAGLAAAFAHEARKLDEHAGKMASPTGGGVRMGNFLHRKADDMATDRSLH
ncbi:tryptophan-rich sensory protein [Brevundimonas sp.]|jgi:translocator protein|uniref:tryptophan-rich sensory protein n=1 Tax=Brevundimonas sp. TaxID=1871086 RepID=UPI0017937C3F|nr:tryptophan-rich sensory protein [Brevundimonas sp.]MBA4809140.1 tryptophan-rich sensory protein [Brevundimonas sp.]